MTNTRALGGSGLAACPIGLGCMSLSGVYGECDLEAAIKLVHHAVDQAGNRGVTMLDTADMYGWGHNEELLAKAIDGRRDKILLASKFGQTQKPGGGNGVDGRPEYVRQACEASLTRLKVDHIDLYYVHRIDPQVPIEETIGEMVKLLGEGKIGAIGLSEAAPETIRRAHAVHPLAAVQSEYSLMYRAEAEETRETTGELEIAFVAYSPLGRSLLTGSVKSVDDLGANDRRRDHPRFAEGNLEHNVAMTKRLEVIAADKGCTMAQLALAWLMAQGDDMFAIPGTRNIGRLEQNIGALDVVLTAEEKGLISDAFPHGAAAGTRYPAGAMKHLYA